MRYYQVYLVVTGGLAWPFVATPTQNVRPDDWPGAELRLMGAFEREDEAFAFFDTLLAAVPDASS